MAFVFFLSAGWFLWQNEREEPLRIDPGLIHTVPPEAISTAPRRRILAEPPTIRIAGRERRCAECHNVLAAAENLRMESPHKVTLDHGPNNRCDICHHAKDRERLALLDGTPLAFLQAPRLCAQCHRMLYRDWFYGVHGRTNGYWDASRGPVRRLLCTECHNPHTPRVPAMDPLKPLPPPTHPYRFRKPDMELHIGRRAPAGGGGGALGSAFGALESAADRLTGGGRGLESPGGER